MVLEASGSESGGEEGGSGFSPRARHGEVSVLVPAGHTRGAEPGAKPQPELLEHQGLSGEAQTPPNPQDTPGSSLSPELHPGDPRVTPPTRTTVVVDVHVSAGGHGGPGQGQAAEKSELLSGGEQEDEDGAGRGEEQEDEDGAWGDAEKDEDGTWRGAELEDWIESSAEQKEDGASGSAEQKDWTGSGAEPEEDGVWGNGEQDEDRAWGDGEQEDGSWGDAEQEDEDGGDAEHTSVGKALWKVPLQKTDDTTAALHPLEEPELPLKAAEPGEGTTNGQRAAQEQRREESKAPAALQLGQGMGSVPEGVKGAAGESERAGEMAEACGDGQTPEESPACLPETQEEEIHVSREGKPKEH
ncbi:hypothetical protein HGM15179_011632 [Zosterops borbonicus]|uniref:Uncharacterized protein n=1 Tax=Zosterops borbonicus TaxID=364589 RepID=A0A8K1GB95_9PASS|nr:hypothetical protein HGM15179_011632 [Zosterops borbonicus]